MKRSLSVLALVVAVGAGAGYWYIHGKLPQRAGEVAVKGLQAPVTVRYDSRGVPHLQAQGEADLYRALGYVHAQDRLFQMEIMRRLARGELA
ncbi:MAG TPA: penicillin acylase family protein, partial [Pseudomonas sp.]|nr:penicillin acylase family protein [Pseudomonas sp.]